MHQAKKRKSNTHASEKPTRRALSCTECKRRKTKCSALGKTPCESCVRRGRPEDCRWEGYDVDVREPSKEPPNEVNSLREQINRLEQLVNTLTQTITPHHSRRPSINQRIRSNHLEDAAINLEHLIVGPGVRPGITETLGSHDPHPVSLAQSQGEIAPTSASLPLSSLFSSPSYDPALISVLPQILPNSPIAQQLVQAFFDGPIHSSWHVIARQAFEKRLMEYRILNIDQFELQVDPLWFAIYLMVLALATKFPRIEEGHIFVQCDDQSDLPFTLYKASVKALEASDYLSRPQIRHIQVSIMYIVFLFHFGNSIEQANIALRYLDSAITTAQWLQLDNLNINHLIKDTSLVGLSEKHSLEICKQLHHLLKFMDGTIFKRPGLWRLNMNDKTSLPQNTNDSDHGQTPSPAPLDSNQMTEASLSIMGSAFVDTIRGFSHQKEGSMNLEEIIAYDTALNSVINSMPTLPNSESAWMMRTLLCSIHYRLIRLHRPMIFQGYTEPNWKFSTVGCVKSAQKIMDIQQDLAQWPHLRPGQVIFSKRWIMGSVIVLAIDSILGESPIEKIRIQAQHICIGDSSDLMGSIDHILNSSAHLKLNVKGNTKAKEFDIDLFFKDVKSRLSKPVDKNPSNDLFPPFDINEMISSFDFSSWEGDGGSISGSLEGWTEIQW